jgi:hypothetical protein
MATATSHKLQTISLGSLAAVASGTAAEVGWMHEYDQLVLFTGTFVGTFHIEVSNDGTNWLQDGSNVTAVGCYKMAHRARYRRIRCSAYTSGTAVASVEGVALKATGAVRPIVRDLGSLAAVANGSAVDTATMYDQSVYVTITGTFVATLQVQVSMDGTNWVQSGSNITTTGCTAFTVRARYHRLACTAYTSGTAVGSLIGIENVADRG